MQLQYPVESLTFKSIIVCDKQRKCEKVNLTTFERFVPKSLLSASSKSVFIDRVIKIRSLLNRFHQLVPIHGMWRQASESEKRAGKFAKPLLLVHLRR